MRRTILTALPLLAVLGGLEGCHVACRAVEPKLENARALLADAQTAALQARMLVPIVDLPPQRKEFLRSAVRRAIDGLDLAERVIEDAQQACEAPDPATAFAKFVEAWDDIKTSLPHVIMTSTTAPPIDVPDPKVYTLYRHE